MLSLKLVDGIIPEPLGGAQAQPDEMFQTVKDVILKTLAELKQQYTLTLVEKRIAKFCSMGVYIDSEKEEEVSEQKVAG